MIDAAAGAGSSVGRLRLTVTGGPGPAGSERGTDGATVLVVTGPPSVWPATAAVATVPFTRNPTGGLAGVKSTSYAENVIALARAHEAGASEAIFADVHGRLSEGTGSNVFVARGGRLLTPSLATACLAGITRELVLEAVEAEETDVADARRPATGRRGLPHLVDPRRPAHRRRRRHRPGPGPGPLTSPPIQAFAALQAKSLDP